MFAVKGFYDGNAVQLNTAALPTKEKYSVVVTFLHPAQQPEADVSEVAALSPTIVDDAVEKKRREAFEELKALTMALKQPVPPDFDYKKELAEYRDERYGYLSCLQAECAESIGADYIITRNVSDFAASTTSAILPEEFLAKLEAEK